MVTKWSWSIPMIRGLTRLLMTALMRDRIMWRQERGPNQVIEEGEIINQRVETSNLSGTNDSLRQTN